MGYKKYDITIGSLDSLAVVQLNKPASFLAWPDPSHS